MSWQAASIVVIAVVLLGGFAWYERSRPSARIVALVAALAALAVAGRVALAPLPNVVATTDIVLLTGYTLGAAPGFAVGALAALVSNIWLGQGPWTPWQMAGWGMVGLGGAWLALAIGRDAGRVILATAAAVAAFAYGALLDYSVMVNFGGEQSLDRYLAISARSVPFNIAHAAGNVAIMLAVGTSLVAMLARFRVRSTFEWPEPPRRAGIVRAGALGALLLVGALAAPALAASPAAKSRDWLVAQQNTDGGWGNAPGAESSPGMSAWVLLGLEAAGTSPLDVASGGQTGIDYLRAKEKAIVEPTDLERTILVLEGAGIDSRSFAGRDLVAELRRKRKRSGEWAGGTNPTAFGILALAAAGGGDLSRSAQWLAGAQNDDGGWGFAPGAASDADSTGAAIQSLGAAGGQGGAVRRGVAFLRDEQRADGGFGASRGLASNSQSTAWSVQGLVAAGVDPAGVRRRGNSPLDFLLARRRGDGSVRYQRDNEQTLVWVTAQAAVAFAQQAFPLAPVKAKSGGSGGEATDAEQTKGGEGGKGPSRSDSGNPGAGQGPATGTGGERPRSKEKRRSGSTKESERKRSGPKPGAGKKETTEADPTPVVRTVPGPGDVDDDDGSGPWLWLGIGLVALGGLGGAGWWAYRHGYIG